MALLKWAGKPLAVLAGVLLLWTVCPQPGSRREELGATAASRAALPELTYRMPILDLPFVKERFPVPIERLPIPAREVAKTIEIAPGAELITLVIDHQGAIYAIPPSAQVKVTRWEPPFLEIRPRFTFSLVWGRDLMGCLSYDPVRLGRVRFGVDLGVGGLAGVRFLAGTSVKIDFAEAGPLAVGIVAGRDWVGSKYYAGLNVGLR